MAGPPAKPTGTAGGREIAAAAKAFDYDRYVAALLTAEPERDDILILLAFASEVGAAADRVSEPRLGQIRLQWWRDALEAPAGERTGHPLADLLRDVMSRRGITAPLLLGLIDASEFLLERRPMPDALHLKSYLVKTEGTLFQAAAQMLGGQGSMLDAVCESAGLALGRARLVLGFGRQFARGRQLLPVPDVLLACLDGADLRNDNVSGELAKLLRSEADEACVQARKAIEQAGRLPARVRAAFLPVATVEGDMARWRRMDLDPLREAVSPGQLPHVWRIWRIHRRWGKAP